MRINKKSIYISQASRPADIYWYNMKVSEDERTQYIFYSSVVLFMLLVLSFVALLGI